MTVRFISDGVIVSAGVVAVVGFSEQAGSAVTANVLTTEAHPTWHPASSTYSAFNKATTSTEATPTGWVTGQPVFSTAEGFDATTSASFAPVVATTSSEVCNASPAIHIIVPIL